MNEETKITFKLKNSHDLYDNINNLLIISLSEILKDRQDWETIELFYKTKNDNIDRMIKLLESIKLKEVQADE